MHVSTSYAERLKSYNANEHPPVYAADQCLLKEGREPRSFRRTFTTCTTTFAAFTRRCTYPTMAAGVTDKLWEIGDIVKVLEGKEKRDDHAPCLNFEGKFVKITYGRDGTQGRNTYKVHTLAGTSDQASGKTLADEFEFCRCKDTISSARHRCTQISGSADEGHIWWSPVCLSLPLQSMGSIAVSMSAQSATSRMSVSFTKEAVGIFYDRHCRDSCPRRHVWIS